MMDLIDRAALKTAIRDYANEPVKLNDRRWDTKCTAIIEDMIGTVNSAPTIEAVPLDKLCELCEETGASVPCAICSKIMPEWCKKNNNFPLSWDEECTCPSWKATLIKWMEGLDEKQT